MVTASVASDYCYVRRGSFENLHNVLSVAQQWQRRRARLRARRGGKTYWKMKPRVERWRWQSELENEREGGREKEREREWREDRARKGGRGRDRRRGYRRQEID